MAAQKNANANRAYVKFLNFTILPPKLPSDERKVRYAGPEGSAESGQTMLVKCIRLRQPCKGRAALEHT